MELLDRRIGILIIVDDPSVLFSNWLSEKILQALRLRGCFNGSDCARHIHEDCARHIHENNAAHVLFVFANSKVAPRSATSVPRLELCAAVEASQSAAYVASELKDTVNSIHLYSDSEITLGYIRNKQRIFTSYVTTRVDIILKSSNPSQWNYNPSKENPADRASRPHSAVELSRSNWLSGPDFLKQPQLDLLPERYAGLNLPETIPFPKALATKELKPNYVLTSVVKKSSSWNRAINIVSFIMKFISKLRKQVFDQVLVQQRATSFLLGEAQKESFPNEHKCLLTSTLKATSKTNWTSHH